MKKELTNPEARAILRLLQKEKGWILAPTEIGFRGDIRHLQWAYKQVMNTPKKKK